MSEELNEDITSSNDAMDESYDSDTDTNDESSDESANDPDERIKALEEQNKKLFARAKKAEGFVQNSDGEWVKPEPKPEPQKVQNQKTIKQDPTPKVEDSDIDAKILRATKGYDDDAIDELRFIAEREGTSILAATESKRFKRYMDEVEAERKKAEASLGASKGSGRKQSQPSFSDNLSEDEHRALAAKMGIR